MAFPQGQFSSYFSVDEPHLGEFGEWMTLSPPNAPFVTEVPPQEDKWQPAGVDLRKDKNYVLETLPDLHKFIHTHLLNNKMSKTAECFLKESKFFPSQLPITINDIPLDPLSQTWHEVRTNSQKGKNSEVEIESSKPISLPTSTTVDITTPEQPVQNLLTPKQEILLPKEGLSDLNKKAMFCCTFPGCSGGFTTLANMKRHEKLHSGERPYICKSSGCGKNFARKYDLKVHQRTHTKEKPYPCEVENCGKRFSRTSSLREHERNIHKIDIFRPSVFICEVVSCKKKFPTEIEFELHQEQAHSKAHQSFDDLLQSYDMGNISV